MGASVVLWGEVLRLGNENALQFFITHSDACGLPREGRYALREGLRVPRQFWGDLTSVLALIACSESVSLARTSESAATRLRLIARVRPLLDNLTLDPSTRRALLYLVASSLMDLPVGDASNTEYLLEAHDLMLEVASPDLRQYRPDLWIQAQQSLGLIEYALAGNEDVRGWSYETAIRRYRETIPVAETLGQQATVAALTDNLGLAMSLWAHQRRDAHLANEAIATLIAASDSYRKLGRLDFAASSRTTAANSRMRLAEFTSSSSDIRKAVGEYRSLATPELRGRYPRRWVIAQLNLANALATIGLEGARLSPRVSLGERKEYLSDSIATGRELLERINEADDIWPTVQCNLGRGYLGLGELERSTSLLQAAVAAFDRSLRHTRREVRPDTWASVQRDHAAALRQLGVLLHDATYIDRSVSILREVMATERDPAKQRGTSEQMRTTLRGSRSACAREPAFPRTRESQRERPGSARSGQVFVAMPTLADLPISIAPATESRRPRRSASATPHLRRCTSHVYGSTEEDLSRVRWSHVVTTSSRSAAVSWNRSPPDYGLARLGVEKARETIRPVRAYILRTRI